MDISTAVFQRIGRRRMQTMFPGVRFQYAPSSYTVNTFFWPDHPIQFCFSEQLALDAHGLPVILGGIQYAAGLAELEQDLWLDPEHGIDPGLGKFAFITGDFSIQDGALSPEPDPKQPVQPCIEPVTPVESAAHWQFQVCAPDCAQHLMIWVMWSPDYPPPQSGVDCDFGCMCLGQAFARRLPRQEEAGSLSQGVDLWVVSRCQATEPYFALMTERIQRRFGIFHDSRNPTQIAADCRRQLAYLVPLMRRLQVRIWFESSFCKIVRGRYRKWFLPYTEESLQNVVDCICMRALRSALGYKMPHAPYSTGMAIARVF